MALVAVFINYYNSVGNVGDVLILIELENMNLFVLDQNQIFQE